MSPRKHLALILAAIIIAWSSQAVGGVPPLMNYQGRLLDSLGSPLDTTVTMIFAIYDDSTTGDSVWSESISGVSVNGGLFSVTLGLTSSIPDSAFADEDRWLDITVGGQAISPRTRLTSVGYAYQAAKADTADMALSGPAGQGGWTDDGDVVRLTTGTDSVGIGTSSPTEKLDVDGNMRLTGDFTLGVSAPADTTLKLNITGRCDSTTPMVRLNHVTSYPWDLLRPVFELYNPGYDYTPFTILGGGVIIQETTNKGAFSGKGSGTIVTRIGPDTTFFNGGKVGIGTSTPQRNLDISGTALVVGADPGDILYVENTQPDNGHAVNAVTHAEIDAAAVKGTALSPNGKTYGVHGTIQSSNNSGGGSAAGVYGEAAASVDGSDAYGVFGVNHTSGGFGADMLPAAGVRGLSYADHGQSYGVMGETRSNDDDVSGLYGFGNASGKVHGVYGITGSSTNGSAGVFGVSGPGGNTYGVYGRQDSPMGLAGKFEGDVDINGTLTHDGGLLKIDHPLDPENLYLCLNGVLSPDMVSIFSGNVITDASGLATVQLPDYTEALSTDFRYQLTVIGDFARAVIAEEINDNRFVIKTDKGGVKVSWQVTGIGRDSGALMGRLPNVIEKSAAEKGTYRHPEAFGLDKKTENDDHNREVTQ